MDFTALQADVLRKLNSDSTFWPPADIQTALNYVYKEACEISECYETQTTKTLTASTTYYDLEDETNSGAYEAILTINRIWNPTTSVWLDIKTVTEMDRERPRWGASFGEPFIWIPRGASTIGVYPKPSGSSSTLLIRHTAIPNSMSAGTDTPVFPPQFHSNLTTGAVAYLKGYEREYKAAARYWKDYLEQCDELKYFMQNRVQRDHITVVGSNPVVARR